MATEQTATKTARDYYNSEDADLFYAEVWGGEDIHIGLYQQPDESIFDASRRTVEHMASRPRRPAAQTRVLDIGSGYGGAARFLASEFGCRVTALNLSEVENARHRTKNRQAGLEHLVEVVDGSFEDVPADDATFDLVWSQDAILHSSRRSTVLEEVQRVLKKGGEFVFSDPMQADDCPEGVLQPILDRIHLESLGSPSFYRRESLRLGLSEVAFEDLTHQLTAHYGRVLQETERRESELSDRISGEYLARMRKGLGHWVEGGHQGHLVWGIFHFRKD